MSDSNLPAARSVLSTRSERLWSHIVAGLRAMKGPVKWLAIAVAAVASVYGVWFGCQAYSAHRREKDARKSATCIQRPDNVRLDDISRLQIVHGFDKDEGKIYIKAWGYYIQPPGSVDAIIDENSCDYTVVVDVPAGEPMWATQHAEWRSGSCECWMVYHVRSMDDLNNSIVERESR